jgi:hypothetical protein
MFFDDMGNLLAESMEHLSPGQAAHLDFDATTRVGGQRVQIRAMVLASGRRDRTLRQQTQLEWIATVEVFDTETKSTVFMHPMVVVGGVGPTPF